LKKLTQRLKRLQKKSVHAKDITNNTVQLTENTTEQIDALGYSVRDIGRGTDVKTVSSEHTNHVAPPLSRNTVATQTQHK
jgi:hypothetical protein